MNKATIIFGIVLLSIVVCMAAPDRDEEQRKREEEEQRKREEEERMQRERVNQNQNRDRRECRTWDNKCEWENGGREYEEKYDENRVCYRWRVYGNDGYWERCPAG